MLKNIVFTGRTGRPILETVAASGQFNITLLIRKPISLYQWLPKTVAAIEADFTSHKELDTGTFFRLRYSGIALINAAVEAETVKLFIPSEWGSDTAVSAESVVSAPKRAVHNYLYSRAADPSNYLAYAFFMTGVVIEASIGIGMMGFDFEKKIAVLADDGVHPFSATALRTVCRVVVAILSNFDKVKNKTIHISNGITTLEELLAITEKTLDEKWT